MSVQWPTPRLLEGVKSRKRAIWELDNAVIAVKDGECKVPGIVLTLDSRIVAIGDAGRALADLLLEIASPIRGKPTRHSELHVLHIGSHLSDADSIVQALESRPQVVVVTQSRGMASTEWAKTFDEVVQSDGFKSFRGAAVICVDDEECLPKELCNIRWQAAGGQLHAEDICVDSIVIEDLCARAASEPVYAALLTQVSELAAMYFHDYEEDGNHDIAPLAAQQGWKVTAIAIPQSASSPARLIGYVAYGADEKLDALCLARVAVVPEFRRRGYAAQLVRWTVAQAKKEGHADVMVHAVPALQIINASLGFSYCNPADEDVPYDERKSAWMTVPTGFQELEAAASTAKAVMSKHQRRLARKRR